jgi:hypothetical protein
MSIKNKRQPWLTFNESINKQAVLNHLLKLKKAKEKRDALVQQKQQES